MEAIIAALLQLLSSLGPTLAPSGVLALLAQVAPSLATGSIGAAIKLVGALIGPGIALAKDELPIIKSIIADLKGNKSTTAAQMDELDTFDAQCDARFDVALAAAQAEDDAAAKAGG